MHNRVDCFWCENINIKPFLVWFGNGMHIRKNAPKCVSKLYFSLRGQKAMFEIRNIIKEILDIKILTKQNKLNNKILFGYYKECLKLKERSEGSGVAKEEKKRTF